MKIKVLGAFGSENASSSLTGFLLNGSIMLDAGTISTGLTTSEQAAITHVILSHAHLDHTKGIPFMLDNVIGLKKDPVEIAGIAPVLDTLHENIFNNRVWPDFTKLPKGAPVLKLRRLVPGRRARVGGLVVRPIPVNHTVPTTGYIITENGKSILYSGDTKATEDIWKAASALGDSLKAVFVETSFPNRMQALADTSGHLTPKGLGRELKKLGGYDGPVYIYHCKSQFMIEIERELDALGRKDIVVVRDGEEWEI